MPGTTHSTACSSVDVPRCGSREGSRISFIAQHRVPHRHTVPRRCRDESGSGWSRWPIYSSLLQSSRSRIISVPLYRQYRPWRRRFAEGNVVSRVFSGACATARPRLERIPRKAPRTGQDNRRQLGRLRKVFGEMRPVSVRPKHIYEYLDIRSRTALTAANREFELLSHTFTKAIQWGVLDENPCRHVRRDDYRPKPRKRYVTDNEFEVAYGLATDRMQIAMDLAVLTGLRQGDILSLTRDNVTKEGLLVHTSKTEKLLLIEWSPELKKAVRRARQLKPRVRLPLLCTRQGKRYSSSGFKANWQRLMGKAVEKGIDRFTFHDLRAKSASDDSLAAASDRLGHTNREITRRVYRRKPEKVRPLR